MNRETAKSLLLAGLVALSIGLSAQFWFASPPPRAVVQTPPRVVEVVGLREQHELLMPWRVMVHTGGSHLVLLPTSSYYAKAWDGLLPMLSQLRVIAEPQNRRQASQGDIELIRGKGYAVELIMPVELPLELWLKLWGDVESKPSGFSTRRVILALTEQPRAYVEIGSGEGYYTQVLQVKQLDLAKWRAALAPGGYLQYRELPRRIEGVAVQSGIYVPVRTPMLGPLVVESEKVEVLDVAGEFLPDMSVARRIDEKDGAVMYTDGLRVVRVYPGGSVEYRALPPESGLKSIGVASVLERGAGFVARHGGWPEGSFTSAVLRVAESASRSGELSKYLLSYSYRYGDLPVVGYQPPISVTVSSTGILEYQRAIRMPVQMSGPLQQVISPEKAIRALIQEDTEKKLLKSSITDVYLGFYNQDRSQIQDTMRPVWAVELDRGQQVYFIDAFSAAVYAKPEPR